METSSDKSSATGFTDAHLNEEFFGSVVGRDRGKLISWEELPVSSIHAKPRRHAYSHDLSSLICSWTQVVVFYVLLLQNIQSGKLDTLNFVLTLKMRKVAMYTNDECNDIAYNLTSLRRAMLSDCSCQDKSCIC